MEGFRVLGAVRDIECSGHYCQRLLSKWSSEETEFEQQATQRLHINTQTHMHSHTPVHVYIHNYYSAHVDYNTVHNRINSV